MASPAKGAKRLGPIAALAAGEAYSIYATFFTHALRLPSVYVVDQYTYRRLLPGNIGYIEEVFYWPDLIRLLAVSLLIFALVWCGAWIAFKFVYERRSLGGSFQEIPTLSTAQTIADPIERSMPAADGLLLTPRDDVQSRACWTATEKHQADASSQPPTTPKVPIVLEAAWEIINPAPPTLIVDAGHPHFHTANVAASLLKARRAEALRRYHNSGHIQRAR